jgi:hypothetical protein
MKTYRLDAEQLRLLEQKFREKICAVCIDRNPDGTCDYDDQHSCTLMQKIPEAVEAISRVESPDIGPYIESLRKTVCQNCSFQQADQTCIPRNTDRCMLDSYLALVVEVIEEHFGHKRPASAHRA